MSNDKYDPRKGPTRPGEQAPPKRPTATIDLSAKVIETRDLPGAEGRPATPVAGAATVDTAAGTSPSIDPASIDKPASGAGAVPPISGKASTSSASPEMAKPGKPELASMPPVKPADGGRRSGGFLSHMLAGVTGAVLALFGGELASRQLGLDLPIAGSGSGARIETLGNRIGVLERSLAEQASDAGESVIKERIEVLATQLEQLKLGSGKLAAIESTQQGLAAAVSELKTSLASLPAAEGKLPEAVEKRVAAMAGALAAIGQAAKDGGGGRVAQLADLAGRINDFELQLDSRLDALRRSVAQDLERQGASITQRIAENVSSGESSQLAVATLKEGSGRLARDLEALKLETSRINEKYEAGKAADEEVRRAVEAAREKADAMESALADLRSGLDDRIGALVRSEQVAALLAPLAAELTGIKGQLSTVVEREQGREQGANRILLSLELANLKRAIDRGGSFASELAAVKRLAPEGLPLQALEAAAGSGLPSQQGLEGSFQPAARAILDADAVTATDGSFFDTLLSGARSVVRVRKTGEVAGEDAEAVVARMESRLQAGDLEGVLREAEGLKGGARAAADPWLQQIVARLTIDRSIGDIEVGLKKLMGSGN